MTDKIGLVEGGGTGSKVASIFSKVVSALYEGDIDFVSFKERFNYEPHTFLTLRDKYYDKHYSDIREIVQKEREDLKDFYNDCKNEVNGVFRTAINAETLYYLRKDIKKIKVVPLTVEAEGNTQRILFIRDQLQGYYANEEIEHFDGQIDINCRFSQENFNILSEFTSEMIEKFKFSDYDLYFLYKFHLFGVELQKMIEKSVDVSNLSVPRDLGIFQPDTGIHKLLGELMQSEEENDLVVVTSNEIGDFVLEALIHYYNLATKETFYTLNMGLFQDADHAFAHKPDRLEVLQTMHGSADDIAGKGILNPLATIRAAAYALESWLGADNAEEIMERAITKAKEEKHVTPDMGGSKSTDEVVEFLIKNF